MGNSISISFKNGKEESVTLYSMILGKDFLKIVERYLKDLNKKIAKGTLNTPVTRKEPDAIIIDFIAYLRKRGLYKRGIEFLLLKSPSGHISDQGHYVINLETSDITYDRRRS